MIKKKYDVYLKISESPYIFEDKETNRFYFSSEFNLKRFAEKMGEWVEEQNQRTSIRYEIPIDLRFYFKLALYKDIEKRGFRVETAKGVLNTWVKVKFVGQMTTSNN